MAKLSPMMQQYLDIKKEYDDCIIFFRLGDFYEMFFDDAKVASKELELALTGRDCGLEERAPMCGVPYHSCDAYIARMVEKGYKIGDGSEGVTSLDADVQIMALPRFDSSILYILRANQNH